MRILPYYIVHTFINSIKKLFKTWVAFVIVIIIAMGLIGGIVGGIIGSAVDSSSEPSSTYEQDIDEGSTIEDSEDLSKEDTQLIYNIFEIIVGVISLAVVLFNIYCGDKSGAKIFTMPDVNFLFSSPLKPQSILMFRTVLQMGLAIVSSIYLLFQIPNLVFNVGLGIDVCIALFVAWILILFIGKLTAVFTYTIAATHEKLRKFIRPFVIAIVLAIALAVAGLVYIGKYSFIDAQITVFASKYGRLIPIFGWLRGFVICPIEGNFAGMVIYLLLLLFGCAALVYFIWRIKADFYEDALTNANEMQQTLESAKAGAHAPRKKERNEKIVRNAEFKEEGSKAFLAKTIYNRKRFSKFGIFSNTAETYILVTLAVCCFVKFIIKSDNILPIGFILLVSVYFRNLGNPIANETSHNFIYMVPESPFKKLFYTLLGGLYETLADLLPSVILTAIILKFDILNLVLWLIAWLSLDVFCSSVGLMIELVMPSGVVQTIRAMLGMMIRMIAIIPGLIILVIGAAASWMPLALCIVTLINVAVAALLFLFSPRFLHSGK